MAFSVVVHGLLILAAAYSLGDRPRSSPAQMLTRAGGATAVDAGRLRSALASAARAPSLSPVAAIEARPPFPHQTLPPAPRRLPVEDAPAPPSFAEAPRLQSPLAAPPALAHSGLSPVIGARANAAPAPPGERLGLPIAFAARPVTTGPASLPATLPADRASSAPTTLPPTEVMAGPSMIPAMGGGEASDDRNLPGAAGASSLASGVRGGATTLNVPSPSYPQRSQRLGEEGTVVLDVEVLEDGTVGRVAVVEASPFPRLAEAAIAAARRARFVPATLNGRAVRQDVRIPFQFKLR